MNSDTNNPRIGLFGIGLDSYWRQFPGLHDRLEGYLERIRGGWREKIIKPCS